MGEQLSTHFNEDEFRCKCCKQLAKGGVPRRLLDTLEGVRLHFNAPVTINSGYRCEKHNAAVGGAKDSQHVKGLAADITVRGVTAKDVFEYLNSRFVGGLGSYPTFTHVDVRENSARWFG